MKPTKENRKKFDLDLTYGEIREEKIAEMLTNKKVEVKSERDRFNDWNLWTSNGIQDYKSQAS